MGFINRLFGKRTEAEPPQPGENAQPNRINVNEPLENPKLKKLFCEYDEHRTRDISNQIFEEIVMNAHFLSVITFSEEPEQNKDGMATIKKGTRIQFPMLGAQDEQPVYPVFTDWNELGKWKEMESPKTLILSFDDYEAMVLQDEKIQGIVINPFGNNLFLDRQMIRQLKTKKDIITKGVSEQKVVKDTTVFIGEPKNYPTEMVNAILDHLKHSTAVNRVWLRLMQKENEQSFLLVVDFSGAKEKIFEGIANAARSYLNGMYLDMIPYQERFGKDAVENVTPFYQKNTCTKN